MVTIIKKTSQMNSAIKPKIALKESVLSGEKVADAASKQPQELPLSTRDALKKRELIDLAVERSGMKKRDVKPAIEAALAVLGDALADGRDINMRPMGKIKVMRMKKGVNGQIINARIRQPEEVAKTVSDPLAPDAKEG